MNPEIQLEAIIRLRKSHPCGSYKWKVTRIGADIGLECMGCQRRIMLDRRQLRKRMKGIVSPTDPQDRS